MHKHRPIENEMNAGGPDSKHCPRCNRDLPHESFYTQPSRQDGISGWCKGCHRAQGKLPRERKPKELDRATRRKIAKALKMEDCGDGLVDLTVHREFIVRELLAIVVTTKSEVKKLEALKMIEKLGVIPA
ncbi:MAG: hypothetical protein V3T23_13910 [Nitrososphaerales archaeon]